MGRLAFQSVFIALAFVGALTAQDDQNQPCYDCHAEASMFEGADAARMVVLPDVFNNSVHGSFACADCHQDLAGVTDFPHAEDLAPANCASCHEDVQQVYQTSLHFYARNRGNERAPDCAGCHGAHDILPSSNPDAMTARQNIPQMCASCHGEAGLLTDQLVRLERTAESYAASIHGRAARMGNVSAAICTDCHGVHDLKGPLDPTSSINPQNVDKTCGKCHAEVQQQYERSIHGRALHAGIRESPTCNTCHGEHLILSPGDPQASTFAARQAKETCGACHNDPRITEKYGIADYVVETYVDSYHGWASLSGAEDAATCVDCHTAHWVLPPRDEASTVSPRNVTETCRQCHEDATAAFAASYTHRTASLAANPPVRWVRNAYIVLIALIIGGMLVHNGIILNYYLVEKKRAEQAAPGFLRMDRIQIAQHMILAVTFIGLVMTGFALRFPEAWWVQQLARLGMTEYVRSVIHRVLAVILIGLAFTHVLYVWVHRRGREEFVSMIPRWRDVTDFIHQMRYHLWRRPEHVKFTRYDYTQKAEYWALVWGTVIMALTGFVLWFPATAVAWFPSWIVQVSQTVHYYEAWLATLAILIWHFFFTIFHPREYPMSWTWITGKMPEDNARSHHAEWYEEQLAEAAAREKEDQEKQG
ncbi:MAG TPA: cytochrome c3 family protein [Acidobacteriota bacterium]|nr:cytochrome c3 family protein [Acidobacteriota bacterium]